MSFSSEFSYSTWTPNTDITMCNVPWSNSMKDIVEFPNRAALDNYLSNTPNAFTMRYTNKARANEPIQIDMLYNDVLKYNYVRATNNVQSAIVGDRRMTYYYWILGAREISTHTTELVLQLDVWSTFFTEVDFGSCFVEQGHWGVANEKAFDNFGRDWLTVDEGLDYGREYRTMKSNHDRIMSVDPDGNTSGYNILVATTIDFEADLGADYKTSKVPTAKGSVITGLPSGVSYYVFPGLEQFLTFMTHFSDKGWATSGIVSITAIPQLGFWINDWWNAEPVIPSPGFLQVRKAPRIKIPPRDEIGYGNWRTALLNTIEPRYRKFLKFMTSPYCIVELTTMQGQPVILKPEAWQSANADYRKMISIVPPGQRVVAYPIGYNRGQEQPNSDDGDDGGEWLDAATTISGFPSFAAVNNAASAVLAGSQGGLAFAQQAADWGLQKSLEANNVSYDQASSGIDLASSLTAMQNKYLQQGANVDNAMTGIGAAVNGTRDLGNVQLGSFLTGGVDAMMQTAATNNRVEQAMNQNMEASKLTGTNAEYLRDSNKKLGDWGTRGDYALSEAAILAKTRDISMTPPYALGQVGGDLFNLANVSLGIHLRFKMIDPGAIRRIGEHWIRFGYKIHHRMNLDRLQVMSHFTYWKVSEVYLKGTNIPEGFKNVLIGMLGKGVTVWRNPDDIGNIDMGINTPLEGISA
ncbi:tail knob protein [Microbacterium phage PineapplePizza]|uniref:Tail knob protein n=1 Tax=Microbacterium phage PineapplePizza TaxID=2927268 RepID=A0A976U7J0_9CAUD|nr:tail knob protein [Microbacterium phage PineapplePizza]UVF60417.1 tail knob protein [Microbacterium phage PineapplePizza]